MVPLTQRPVNTTDGPHRGAFRPVTLEECFAATSLGTARWPVHRLRGVPDDGGVNARGQLVQPRLVPDLHQFIPEEP
jgi:hypothetical protein